MIAYLDITQSLLAAFAAAGEDGASLLVPWAGDTVYRLRWSGPDGTLREGFASGRSAYAAKRLLRAHERGYGRVVALRNVRARKWGTRSSLATWAQSRCSAV